MMKSWTFFLLALLCCLGLSVLTVGSSHVPGREAEVIPHEYIVVLQPDTDLEQHLSKVDANFDVTVLNRYEIGEFKGYAIQIFDPSQLQELEQDPEVKYVEPNAVVRIADDKKE